MSIENFREQYFFPANYRQNFSVFDQQKSLFLDYSTSAWLSDYQYCLTKNSEKARPDCEGEVSGKKPKAWENKEKSDCSEKLKLKKTDTFAFEKRHNNI